MAIFPSQTPQKRDGLPFGSEPAPAAPQAAAVPQQAQAPAPAAEPATPAVADFTPSQTQPPRAAAPKPEVKESLIAAELTIEGKIEGTGHVRIAGKFKGDVNVQGDLTIERGAKLTGGVRAQKVTVAGDLDGNIDSAQRVDLLESAALTGDLKAGQLTVAAGSKIRGHIECGWGEIKDAPAKDSAGNGKPNGSGNNGNGRAKDAALDS